MIETTALGLREAALAAHRLAAAEMAERERESAEREKTAQRERLWTQLERFLGVVCRQEPDAAGEIELDGLRFRLSERGRLVLILTCPRCGRSHESGPIYGMPDLGRLLADQEWTYCWSGRGPGECAGPEHGEQRPDPRNASAAEHAAAAADERCRRDHPVLRAVDQQLLVSLTAYLDHWIMDRMTSEGCPDEQ